MTNEQFRDFQDNKLEMSGRELAKALCVTPSSISHWRDDRPIPDYIVQLLTYIRAEKTSQMRLPLSMQEIIGLSRAADRRGITVEALLLELIRSMVEAPAEGTTPISYTADPDPVPALRVAEKPTAYKATLNKPSKD
jgi:hypothetical protein